MPKKCNNCEDLLENIKKKVEETHSLAEIKKLLKLVPENWSVKRIVENFKVSTYIARSSRILYKTSGILALVNKQIGNKLSDNVVNTVIEFYLNDNISIICPGKNECSKWGNISKTYAII